MGLIPKSRNIGATRTLSKMVAVLFALSLGGCTSDRKEAAVDVPERARLGLMTSLPIYWQETKDFGDLVAGATEPNWVRSTIAERYVIQPLDALTPEALVDLRLLLLAQPRAFSSEENVALDAWVREGGKVLIFADPLVTQESKFALGDARAPQAVALVSPILSRWGLQLTFDATQEPAARLERAFDTVIPVNLAGVFRSSDTGFEAQCDISDTGVSARCTIGKGRATLIADADILDDAAHESVSGGAAVEALLQTSLSDS